MVLDQTWLQGQQNSPIRYTSYVHIRKALGNFNFSVYMLLKITTFLEVWLNTHFCTAFGIFTEWSSFFTHSTEIWLKGNKKVTELHIYFSRTFSWHSVSWMKELMCYALFTYMYLIWLKIRVQIYLLLETKKQ